MTELVVRSEAQDDASEAAIWYEGERERLGREFLGELRVVLNRIEDGPRMFPVVTADIRRALLRRFPFGVFFVLEQDVATVIAVMHLHRHPDSWLDRR